MTKEEREELQPYRYMGSSIKPLGKDTTEQGGIVTADVRHRYDIPCDTLERFIDQYTQKKLEEQKKKYLQLANEDERPDIELWLEDQNRYL